MIDIISEMKGKNIVSFQCAEIDKWPRTYGNFRINLEDYAIEFSNEEKEIEFLIGLKKLQALNAKKLN